MESHENHRDLIVTVHVPSEVEGKKFTFAKTEQTGKAAAHAADVFRVHPEAPTFQLGTRVLERAKSLEDDGVKSGDCLDLVSAGGGV